MIEVKFLASSVSGLGYRQWRRQLPKESTILGGCRFHFDPDLREYDWLVVYEKFPRDKHGKRSAWVEQLACPPENTLFVTVEPSSIRIYEDMFLDQFGHVLSAHEPWALQHGGHVRSQPALRWFYGARSDEERMLDLEDLAAMPCPKKTRTIATVCSSKAHGHTLHRKRFEFVQKLKRRFPEIDVFGKGVRPIQDKATAIDPYQYHLAIENHVSPHHWTEKLADAYLGWSIPIYYGCPNLEDYFPNGSFIYIDIDDFECSLHVIQQAIGEGFYEKNFDALREARRRVVEDYNLFSVIEKIATGKGQASQRNQSGVIMNREALRRQSPQMLIQNSLKKLRIRWRRRR